jgi:hypothetical protein
MSDPNEDWLDQELKNLKDLQAPATIVPSVMVRVRQKAKQRWQIRLFHSFLVGLAVACLLGLLLVDPSHLFSEVPVASHGLKLLSLISEAVWTSLFQAKMFHLPVGILIFSIVALSYAVLVGAASTVQRLAVTRK